MSQKLNIVKDEKPWYAEGLRFKCTECGKCCTGAPGYVWVNENEIKEMAEFLNLSIKEFSSRYLRNVHGRLSLREHPKTFDCVFLENKKCKLYLHRPTQCRTFPWWPSNLKSEKDWKETAEYCEGIHPDAPIVEFSTIDKQLKMQEKVMHGHT